MALNKVNYTDNETIITAENLNNIQDAIVTNEENIIDKFNTVNNNKVSKSGDTMTGGLDLPAINIISDGNKIGQYAATPYHLYQAQKSANSPYYEFYYYPELTANLTENKNYNIATSKNYIETVYYANGLLFNSSNLNGYSGYGTATVTLNYFTRIAKIDYHVYINSNAGGSTTDFSHGLNRNLLRNANSNIPLIYPIPGGTVHFIGTDGIHNSNMTGYGGIMAARGGEFWTPARMYNIDSPNSLGQWPTSQIYVGLKMFGTCYGTF